MPAIQPPLYALITCEHASRAVPARWRHLFAGHEAVLASHRGWDPGTRSLGRKLADRLGAPLLLGRATRLLIDLNRSAGHPARYSAFTRDLPREERERIEETLWTPHWETFGRLVKEAGGRVMHLACHSFTPVMDGQTRALDIGLLYDPSRAFERQFCRRLAAEIIARRPDLRIRMNAPYRGTANGLGQAHRRIVAEADLTTVELEINQALVARGDWAEIQACLVDAVEAAMAT